MTGRLLCWLGRHDLEIVYRREPGGPAADLTCRRCGRELHTTYDMCYGETVVMPGHYWRRR